MTSRKNSKADLESKRPLFFLSGISVALIAVIIAFQWKTEIDAPLTASLNINESVFTPFDIPVTRPDKPELPKAPETYKPSSNYLNTSDEVFTKLDLKNLGLIDGGEGEDPVEVIVDPYGDEEPEVISPFVVDRMAVPMKCKNLTTKDEQWECLNSWLGVYISKNMIYPRRAARINLEGKVQVYFVISKDGQVEDIEVLKGEYDMLNDEAKRVISTLPKFRPAIVKGKSVRMSMQIPVNFKLY